MAWVGHTNSPTIGVGISLRLAEFPTIPGSPPRPIQAGAEMAIEMAAGARTKATIVSVSDNEIQIEVPDGTLWQMTHLTPNDFPVKIDSRGLNAQDWVIRFQIQS